MGEEGWWLSQAVSQANPVSGFSLEIETRSGRKGSREDVGWEWTAEGLRASTRRYPGLVSE